MTTPQDISPIDNSVTQYSVIVIGAGQAGMAMSHQLKEKNIDHILLEKNAGIADNWRHERWDAFCLVTPNWQCQLPGYSYQGDDPHGFMVKDEIVDYLEGYYRYVKPPIKFNTAVKKISRMNGIFSVQTANEHYTANNVVLACGSYHKPNILPFSQGIDPSILQIHSKDYKNAQQLPEGNVLVVGTGQSGCQIAEDLHLSGRNVHLSVGTAPRVNRRYRGKDVVDWLDTMGYYETTIDKHPDGDNAPHSTNHYVTGRDGGRDLNLRIFAEQGMQLYGKLETIENNTMVLCDDLKQNLDYADNVAKRIRESIESYIQENTIDAPVDENIHSHFAPEFIPRVNLSDKNITSVVWATGFKMQFEWVDLPVFKGNGHPDHKRGITSVPGLYFLGLNWMNTWGSGRFFHVGRDAEFLADAIEERSQIKASECA